MLAAVNGMNAKLHTVRMDSSIGTSGGRCVACHAPLRSIGVEQFRVGGTGGGWHLIFGEWAELGEQMIPFHVLACTGCRRVELRVPEERPT
jgi:hypothetical protein